MTVTELYSALEKQWPRALSCAWDHDGLECCPDPEAQVRGVLVALDPTEDAVQRAEDLDCNVILTHHPLLFRGLQTVDGRHPGPRKIIRLIQSGIATMSFHTRLDAADGGVNDTLAACLGLTEVSAFGPTSGEDANPAGKPMGRIGTLPAPLSLEAFAAQVKMALDLPAVLCAGCGKDVHRVAVLGGAGDSDARYAEAAGADTFLTGELRYHQLCDAPYGGLNLLAAGHYHTEVPVTASLARMAEEILSPSTPVHVMRGTRIRVL